MTQTAVTAMAMLAAETALREAETPLSLAAPLLETPLFSFEADAFLLALPSGLRFHYCKGHGVTFSRPAALPDAEVALFHSGSVYGAVAWLNGLVPLHASAVVHDGQVHAFTGSSGAGKSTLSAALSQRGFPLFADDVLVLDLTDPARPIALPGHKKLKLWAESLELTGLSGGDAVRHDVNKYFVSPKALKQDEPLPIASLHFLDAPSGKAPSLTALSGTDCFARMRAAFYRPRYGNAVLKPQEMFAIAARLGAQIELSLFDRPLDREQFDTSVAFIAEAIRDGRD